MIRGRRIRPRFWLEMMLAATGVVLIALTLAVPDWIEGLTGQDPDGGSGAAVAPHPVTFRDRDRRLQQLQTAASDGPRLRADRDRSHEGERWRKSMAVDHDSVSR